MPKYIVTVHQLNTYHVEADSNKEAEDWVQFNEVYLGRDQENEYECYYESEEDEEDWV